MMSLSLHTNYRKGFQINQKAILWLFVVSQIWMNIGSSLINFRILIEDFEGWRPSIKYVVDY